MDDFKEACRLFWMVKGHLNTSRETILSSQDSYFKRLWIMGSNGAPLYESEEGFEEAYKEYIENENE
tara:strand:- start:568 stop:768 length:201 start_codon:yes stop_codon:yes gene_type:complete